MAKPVDAKPKIEITGGSVFDKKQADKAAASGGKAAGGSEASSMLSMLGPEAASIGRLAAAAGPAAIAILGVQMATKAVVDKFGNMERAIDSAGQATAKLAGGDNMGAISAAFQGVTRKLDDQGPALQIFSAALKTAAAPITAFTAVTEAAVKRGRELAGYNGSLATAGAKADVRSLMSDIDEAQKLGKDLARLTDAQSRAENDVREILLPIKQVVVGVLGKSMELVADGVAWAKPEIKQIGDSLTQIFDAVQQSLKMGALGDLGKEVANLIEQLERGRKLEEQRQAILGLNNGPIVKWLNAADGLGGGGFPMTQQDDIPKISGPIMPGGFADRVNRAR